MAWRFDSRTENIPTNTCMWLLPAVLFTAAPLPPPCSDEWRHVTWPNHTGEYHSAPRGNEALTYATPRRSVEKWTPVKAIRHGRPHVVRFHARNTWHRPTRGVGKQARGWGRAGLLMAMSSAGMRTAKVTKLGALESRHGRSGSQTLWGLLRQNATGSSISPNTRYWGRSCGHPSDISTGQASLPGSH